MPPVLCSCSRQYALCVEALLHSLRRRWLCSRHMGSESTDAAAFIAGEVEVCTRFARAHPKLYYAWNHRRWLCQRMTKAQVGGVDARVAVTIGGRWADDWLCSCWRISLRQKSGCADTCRTTQHSITAKESYESWLGANELSRRNLRGRPEPS